MRSQDFKLMAGVCVALVAIGFLARHPWRISQIKWAGDLNAALVESRLTNHPVLIDFYSPGCAPCNQMDSETFSDSEVAQMMKLFVPVKINIDKYPALANHYKVSAIPQISILNSNGSQVGEALGFQLPRDFAGFLSRFKSS